MAYCVNCETGLGPRMEGDEWTHVPLGDYCAEFCPEHMKGLDTPEKLAWAAVDLCGLRGWYEGLGLDPLHDGAEPMVVVRKEVGDGPV